MKMDILVCTHLKLHFLNVVGVKHLFKKIV